MINSIAPFTCGCGDPEKAVGLKAADVPSKYTDLPKTREELLKRKAEYDAQRATQRAAKKSATNGMFRR